MSKYHERAAAIAAKHDWTTPEGIAAGLRDKLEVEGYGTKFRIFQDGMSIDEEAARQAIIDEIVARPAIERYQQSLQRMMREDPGVDPTRDWSVFVEADPAVEGLMFEHGRNFRQPVNLDEFEVVIGPKKIEQRLKHRTKTEVTREERTKKLEKKLDDTRDADETFYLFHARQCGYLLRNTAIRFFAQIKGQYGTSTETKILGITLPELQEFVDSAGRELAGVSTHVDTSLEKEGESALKATHRDFAREIFDFLNLEYEVDVDAIARQHREEKSDSGFRSIEHWIAQQGVDSGMVLRKLIERHGNLDSGKIREQFEAGYESRNYAKPADSD